MSKRRAERRLIQSVRANREQETTPNSRTVDPRRLRPHSNQCCQQQTVYAFISNTPQTPALSSGFQESGRDRDAGGTQIPAGGFFYSFLALVGFDRFAQLYRVSCLLLFLLPRHSRKLAISRLRRVNCGMAVHVLVVLALIRAAFSQRSLTRRPEAKQNKTHKLALLPLPMHRRRSSMLSGASCDF